MSSPQNVFSSYEQPGVGVDARGLVGNAGDRPSEFGCSDSGLGIKPSVDRRVSPPTSGRLRRPCMHGIVRRSGPLQS